MTAEAEKTFYLVDAHAYLHRAYHALLPSQLRNKAGDPVWALYGFARMLLSLIKRRKPDYLAVCFDTPEPTFRHKVFKEYKATRAKLDGDLIRQLDRAERMVQVMGIPTVALPGYEADDLLATLARKGTGEGMNVVLVSGDKDALQLVGGPIKVWNEARGVFFGPEKVVEKFKVRPDQLVDYLAIVGDSSDNVPGVPGIGAVGAAKLLGKFGSLGSLLKAAHKGHRDIPAQAARSLVENEGQALMSRGLIVLNDGAPIQTEPSQCRVALHSKEDLTKVFGEFGFKSLLSEILGNGAEAPAPLAAGGAATLELRFVPVEPKALLAAARKSKAIAVAVGKPDQPDLLHAARPMVALALPDGRAATFADAGFDKHRADLKRLLASPRIDKIGHDLKSAQRMLREPGIELRGALSDTMLAAYCLDPSRAKYDLNAVLNEAGAAELPAEEVARSLARQAAAVWALQEYVESELLDAKLVSLYRDLEMPLLSVLEAMEGAGIVVDAAHLRSLGREFESKIAGIVAEIDAIAGVAINLRSPKQLAELFYDKLGLPVIHKTKKGGRSTDEEALVALAPRHEIPAKIIDYRELTKLQSTYVAALLEKIDPKTRRVHSHFNQTGTATGRLSSLDPNLQNIPVRTPHGRKIRRAFTAEKGSVLLSADYSQIDLRVLAHLSGDEALRAAFVHGGDIHRKTASEVFGVAPAKVDREMRRRAKAVNFGIVYGQSAHGLSQELGITRAEAQSFIKAYFSRYLGVERWIKKTLEAARRDGAVATLRGRIRRIPDIHSRNFQIRSFNERVAVNTPIQGSSADIIKVAMINIYRAMSESRKWKARLVLQVHDELIFEVPAGEARAFGRWVRREMETAVRLVVPVVVDVKAGPNWDEMEGLA